MTNVGEAALKFFRTLVSLQDTFYQAQMTHNNTFGLILNIVYETMPRDNLLNSACLELFEYVKRENIKPIILHVVEKYRDKLNNITYVDTFQNLIVRYEQMQGYGAEGDSSLFSHDEGTSSQRSQINGQRWQGVREMDAAEEAYFNTSDDEEEVGYPYNAYGSVVSEGNGLTFQWQQENQPGAIVAGQPANGSASPIVKPLVDYPDDDDEVMDTKTEPSEEKQAPTTAASKELAASSEAPVTPVSTPPQTPPERISEKRRRQDEEDDELVKLSSGPKRRSSSASSIGSSGFLRRRKSFSTGSITVEDRGVSSNEQSISNTAPRKIAINLGQSRNKASTPDKDQAEAGDTQGKENTTEGRRVVTG